MNGLLPSKIPAALRDVIGPTLGLIFVIVVFSLAAPDAFLSASNGRNIAVQCVIVGIGALGMTFVVATRGIDLSVGSQMALSSVITAKLLARGHGPGLALAGGLGSGLLCGLANGLLVAYARILPFVATLGTLGAVRGVAKWLADEQKVDAPRTWLVELMARRPSLGFETFVAPGVWLFAVLAAVMTFVLRQTVFGSRVLAVGSNESTARTCGIPVARTKLQAYALGGLCAGLAGVLQFSRLTVGDPTTATGKELDVIAAVVLGGASLSGGEGSIFGSVLGALLMAALANGCDLTDRPPYFQEILNGTIIVAAVALDRLRHRGHGSSDAAR